MSISASTFTPWVRSSTQLLTGQRLDAVEAWPSRHRLDTVTEIPPALRAVVEHALDPEPRKRFGSAQELADALQAVVPRRTAAPSVASVVVTLHGIRTHASWQRAFAEVANGASLESRLDRWSFGYFSSLRFLLPWSRLAKLRWFRSTYETEFPSLQGSLLRPSIIADSFGTYILGNALLRYPYLRFHKVLLCGSILPTTFPWDALLERGQVQAVRNEYGTEDVWTKLVDWFVPNTGPSGIVGFRASHARLEQERFTFAHSEYFEGEVTWRAVGSRFSSGASSRPRRRIQESRHRRSSVARGASMSCMWLCSPERRR